MTEDQIYQLILAEIRQGMEERAAAPPSTHTISGVEVTTAQLLEWEKEEPGFLPPQFHRELQHEAAHVLAARQGMIPTLVEGKEIFVEFEALLGPYPLNTIVLRVYEAWVAAQPQIRR